MITPGGHFLTPTPRHARVHISDAFILQILLTQIRINLCKSSLKCIFLHVHTFFVLVMGVMVFKMTIIYRRLRISGLNLKKMNIFRKKAAFLNSPYCFTNVLRKVCTKNETVHLFLQAFNMQTDEIEEQQKFLLFPDQQI